MIFLRKSLTALGILMLLTLSACGKPTKEELLKKSENATNRSELESLLGTPNDIVKFGPIEHWTYQASNGQVVFIITGDKVAFQASGNASKKP